MTSKQKEHEKALKGPDQFQMQVMTGMDWLMKHSKELIAGVGLVAAIALGAFAYQKFQVSKRDSRVGDLGKAQIAYEDEQKKANDLREAIQKQVEALQAKVTPPAPKEGEAAPAAPVLDPKAIAEKAALEKQAEAIKADHGGSLKLFQEFFKSHEKTPEGWMAGMTAARILIDQDKVAEAAPILETVLAGSKDNPFYQTQARLALVGIYEDQGSYDKALGELDALEKLVSDDLKPKVLLARGRIQLLKDQKAEAKATFDSLIEKHAASPEAQKARSIQSLFN